MQDIVSSNHCIGCGACELACHVKAISIVFDSVRGLHIPIVEDNCVFCGNCLRVCFGNNVRVTEAAGTGNVLKDSLGGHIRCYSGHATDSKTRFDAASGGIVTALLETMMTHNEIDGAIVSFIDRKNPIKSYSKIASDKQEVHQSAGSKYSPVLILPALKKLDAKKTYAFVGLPCQIFAVKELQKLKCIPDSITTYVSLLCGGTLSCNGTKYVLRSVGLEKTKIREMKYRGNGWPGKFSVVTEGGKGVSIPYVDYWPATAKWFYLDRCMICIDGLGGSADISCGDFWASEVMERDTQGTSVVITRTKHGQGIVQRAIRNMNIECSNIDWKSVMESQRQLFEFKHQKLSTRLYLLNLRHHEHPYRTMDIPRANVNHKALLDEILTHIGRFLASHRLWFFLDSYKVVLKSLINMTSRVRYVIREKF